MDQQSQGKKWYRRWWFIIPAAVVVVVVIASLSGPAPTTDTTSDNLVTLGEEGYLRVANSEIVTVLRTKEAQDEFTTATLAKDTYGMAKIVAEGKGFNVQPGTKVLVIDSEVGIRKVRVLEGEYAMQEGWVPKEFIQKQ